MEKKKIPLWHKIVGWICAVLGLEIILFVLFECYIIYSGYYNEEYTQAGMYGAILWMLLLCIFLLAWAVTLLTGIAAKLQKRPVYHWVLGNLFAMMSTELWAFVFVPGMTAIVGIIMACACTLGGVYYLCGIANFVRRYLEDRKADAFRENEKSALEDEVVRVGLSKEAR